MRNVSHMTPVLDGRRILVVVPPARFDEAAFYQTWQLLSDEGAWLTLVSDSTTGMAVGDDGNVAAIAGPLGTVAVGDLDAVVVIGGPDAARSIPAMKGFEALMSAAAAHDLPVAALAGAETGVEGAIEGELRNLPRLVAELSVRVAKRAGAHPGEVRA